MSEEKYDLNKPQASKRGGCLLIGGIALSIMLCFVSVIILSIFEEGRAFIPGDSYNFDPVAEYAAVEQHAGDNVFLTGIRASFVRRDGTLELSATYEPAPDVYYTFYRLTGNNSNAPVGVNTSDAVEHQDVRISISDPFNFPFIRAAEGDMSIQLQPGMRRFLSTPSVSTPDEALPPPACSFRDLWTIAIEEEEANDEAVAIIQYDDDGYNFYIRGTSVNLDFNFDCQLVD